MELLKFEDTCVISRASGADEWDEESFEPIYEGACLYQEAWTDFYYPVVEHSSVVFLPSNDILIEINDEIVITTHKGRERKAYAQSVKDIKLPLYGQEVTRIVLKQNI